MKRELLDLIYAHARESYPEECCGLIFDDEARRVPNRQNELHARDPEQFPRDAKTAYNMGPRDIRALEDSLKTSRPVRAIYHSHCNVGAYFSAEDKRAATWDGEPLFPNVDYLVVDVQEDGVRGAKMFRFQGGDFVQVEEYRA
jgi:adenylyltransferase/sulfurtransferase